MKLSLSLSKAPDLISYTWDDILNANTEVRLDVSLLIIVSEMHLLIICGVLG